MACFFFNFRANSTTYIYPAEVFPTKFRAAAHGMSAACGKAGAIVSALAFNQLSKKLGTPAVLWSEYYEFFCFFLSLSFLSFLFFPFLYFPFNPFSPFLSFLLLLVNRTTTNILDSLLRMLHRRCGSYTAPSRVEGV